MYDISLCFNLLPRSFPITRAFIHCTCHYANYYISYAFIFLQSVNQVLPQNLFAFSLFPYIGFLYHLTKSKQTPPLTLFGFYFLLVFVFATIPAGIYAKKVYGTSLANVDYLHGCAEFMLTLTNLFIVLGLRKAIRNANATSENNAETVLYDSSSTSTAPRPSNTDATTDV